MLTQYEGYDSLTSKDSAKPDIVAGPCIKVKNHVGKYVLGGIDVPLSVASSISPIVVVVIESVVVAVVVVSMVAVVYCDMATHRHLLNH